MANKGTRKDDSASPNMSKQMFDNVGKPVKRVGPNQKNMDARDDLRWWNKPEEKIASCIGDIVARIETANGQRRTNFVRFAHLYGNYEALGWQNIQLQSNSSTSNNKIRVNVIQSVIDTASSKIAKDDPHPYFITKGQDFFVRLAAEECTNFVEGVMQHNKFADVANDVFRDGAIYGSGFCHWMIEDGKIKCEWCFVDELKVDDYDGMMKSPRSVHRVKIVNKEVLQSRYPDWADELSSYKADTSGARFRKKQSVVDMVRVRESWHLPSKAGADDGVHVISVGDLCLKKEPYDKNYFPIMPWRWMDKPLGYYGRSITEEIYSIQFEINKLLQTAQQAYELVGVPIVFVESGSEVSDDDINQNFIGRMVNYTGTKPVIECPEPLPPSFMQFLGNYMALAYKIPGVSEAAATGTKPAGVESGAAIREVVDIETGRFAQVGTRWEDWYCANAMIILDLAKDLQKQLKEKGDSLVVSKIYKKQVSDIDFSDIADIADNFAVRCDPVSSLPDTSAGRIETITDYINNKWIGKERGMEMLQLDPDLDREVELQIASLRRVDKMLNVMVKSGTMEHPDPYLKLDQALEVSLQVYNLVQSQGCPDDRLALLRAFMDEIVELQKQPSPLQQPSPQGPMAPAPPVAGAPAPQGGPMPPPMPQPMPQ